MDPQLHQYHRGWSQQQASLAKTGCGCEYSHINSTQSLHHVQNATPVVLLPAMSKNNHLQLRGKESQYFYSLACVQLQHVKQ